MIRWGTGLYQCLEIWQEILDKSSIELKRKIYNWFTGHLNGSVIDYMEDYIEKLYLMTLKKMNLWKRKLIFWTIR